MDYLCIHNVVLPWPIYGARESANIGRKEKPANTKNATNNMVVPPPTPLTTPDSVVKQKSTKHSTQLDPTT